MQRKAEATTEKYPSTMYEMVFESVFVKMAVLVLFGFLLLQPVSLAFANEGGETSPSEEVTAEPEVIEESVPEVVVTEAAPIEEILIQDEPEVIEEVQEPVVIDNVDTGEVVEDAEEVVLDDTSSSTEEVEDIETPAEELPTDDGEEVIPDDGEEVSEEDINDETATTTSTTTDELVVDHNSSAYEFDTKECTSVGDGAFYCSSTEDSEEYVQDGVFAAPDRDGDLEIFVRLNGEESIITSNTIDDSAPYYDALSERIVWHVNSNDRYQIMSYDLSSGESTRLTSATYNNMEPVAHGDITLWQAWVNNNWEIIMYDGKVQKQLTSNDVHDVSPHMRGEYVVWQTQFAEGWKVSVYDQETGRIEYVEAEGGAKIENPRFVLVYDSTNEAGDIETVGYDFDNKKSFTLHSIPAQLPDELPEPDQTGETRALIQNKHSVKGVEIEEQEPVPTGNTGSSTPSDNLPTLDLSSGISSSTATSTAVTPDITELVIPPFITEVETEEISHISDILIPPLSATSTAEVR